jgi:hypothetical protein
MDATHAHRDDEAAIIEASTRAREQLGNAVIDQHGYAQGRVIEEDTWALSEEIMEVVSVHWGEWEPSPAA